MVYIILLSFFLLFALSVAKDTKAGLRAVIFLMPLYLARFTIGGIPTTVLEVMIYILSGVWFWKNKGRIGRASITNFFREERLLTWGLALLVVGAFLSTIYSSDLRTSLGAFKGFVLDPLLFFVVYTDSIKTPQEARRTLSAYIYSARAVAFVALLYALASQFTFDGRLRAFYESPNYLAMYLAPAFLLVVCAKDSPYASKGLSLLILAAVLLLTGSYGAILAVAAALAGFFIRRYRRGALAVSRRNRTILAAAALVALVGLTFLSYQKYEHIISSNERSSWHSRLMIWESSRLMLADHPLVGIGPGDFQRVYLNYQDRFNTPYLEWAVPHPHSTLLAFWLGAGLLGLIGFFFILIWLSGRARLDGLIFLFLVYFLVHGLIDTLYWKNDLALIFWLMLAVASVRQEKTAQPGSAGGDCSDPR